MRHNLSRNLALTVFGVALVATSVVTVVMHGANRVQFTGLPASASMESGESPCPPGSAGCPNEQSQALDADQLRRTYAVLLSAQMASDAEAAITAAETLWGLALQEPLRGSLPAQQMMATRYFVHTQFNTPHAVLAIPAPGEGFPYAQAMWHYARGVARAASGDAGGAQQHVEAITLIQLAGNFTTLTSGAPAAKDAVRTARHVLQARIAQARGQIGATIVELERAAAIEDTLPDMQPPYWYFPVRRSLGAALLMAGQPDRAEQAFRACLDRNPDNGWALFGLAEVYQQRGFTDEAEATRARLANVWVGNRNRLALAQL